MSIARLKSYGNATKAINGGQFLVLLNIKKPGVLFVRRQGKRDFNQIAKSAVARRRRIGVSDALQDLLKKKRRWPHENHP